MKVINLFSGPSSGKSTTRAGLFHLMKTSNESVEEVTEYAKDITWEGTQVLLADQLFVLANQNRRLERLRGKVQYAISDSPLLLTINYVHPTYLPHTFKTMTMELWNTYENYNFFINRTKPYNPEGRNQTYAEALQIDEDIKLMLNYHKIPYNIVDGNNEAPKIIYEYLQKMKF